jgi:hypothetical protein
MVETHEAQSHFGAAQKINKNFQKRQAEPIAVRKSKSVFAYSAGVRNKVPRNTLHVMNICISLITTLCNFIPKEISDHNCNLFSKHE